MRSTFVLLPAALLVASVGCGTTVSGEGGVLTFSDVSPSIHRGLSGGFGLVAPIAVGAAVDVVVRDEETVVTASASSDDPGVLEVVSDGAVTTLVARAQGTARVRFDTALGEDSLLLETRDPDDVVLAPRLPYDLLASYALDEHPAGVATLPGARVGVAGRAWGGGEPLAGYGYLSLDVVAGEGALTPFPDDAEAFWLTPSSTGQVTVQAALGAPWSVTALGPGVGLTLQARELDGGAPVVALSGPSPLLFQLTLTDRAGHLVLPPPDAEATAEVVVGEATLVDALLCDVESGLCTLTGANGQSGTVRLALAGASLELDLELTGG